MLYIEDYRKLPVFSENPRIWDLTELLGQNCVVRTQAGAYSGVVVGEDRFSITLVYTRAAGRRRQRRRIVISKSHIVAIDACLR